MKRMPLLTAALALVLAAAFTSCKPSRVWATKDKDEKKEKKYDRDDDRDDRDDDRYARDQRYDRYDPPPPPPPPAPRLTRLVISPTPGFTMQRSPDGRYYHRTSGGLLYWKGYDNRFCLDRNQLRSVSFSQYDYDEWKRFTRQSR